MLARHLLFLATRRHHNTLLAIPSDSVPPQAIVQPPPYISPPKPEDRQKEQKIKEILKDPQTNKKYQTQNEKQQRFYPQEIYTHDPRRNLYDNQKFYEHNKIPDYNSYYCVSDHQIIDMQNARNRQFYALGKDINQQFFTLPSRRPQREVEPPRSVTPDITRGLGRGSLSAMHMLARHGQKPMGERDSHRFGSQGDLNARNSENYESKSRLVQNQHQSPIVDVRNRFATPLGLTALGYRFFASSPVRDPVMKSPSADALKHNPISPIGHTYGNSFKSSTPVGRAMPTVAERLTLSTNNNGSTSMPNSGRSTPIQTSSGRSTPTNLILSPTKSTMSNEELFAAIHKSKKRLNIKEDSENMSPYGSMNSLVKSPAGNRHSWSPESQKAPEITQPIQSPSATSRLDFKRLLLQQSVKTGPSRVSAAEQLKLSRQQCQQQQTSTNTQQSPLAKVLSPRSVWRFQTPRTDVLSSTIIEDTAAEEKAMKPSPESTSPISRVNARRQLDLCNNFSEDSLCVTSCDRKVAESRNDRVPSAKIGTSDNKFVVTNEKTTAMQELAKRKPIVHDNHVIDSAQTSTFAQSASSDQNVLLSHTQSNTVNTQTTQYSPTSSQLTPTCQQAISAFESRRISNQLARAQFLASTPTNTNQRQDNYFGKRFRARSESPQHSTTQNVARSPSAPTLETAL